MFLLGTLDILKLTCKKGKLVLSTKGVRLIENIDSIRFGRRIDNRIEVLKINRIFDSFVVWFDAGNIEIP